MPHPDLRLALVTGFSGAFTTFSAYAVQTIAVGREGRLRMAALNVAPSTLAGLAAVGWVRDRPSAI